MFGALFLFACDSSSTAKVTPTGNTYFISAKVTGLKGTGISLYSGNDIAPFKTDGTLQFDTKISEGSKYKVGIVVGTTPQNQTCTVAANGSGDKMSADVIADVTCVDNNGNGGLTGNITDGKVYYMSECAACHKALSADTSYTFSSSDLADNYRIAKLANRTNIIPDMHAIGPAKNLMGRFDKIPAQSVADLEAYLGSVAP